MELNCVICFDWPLFILLSSSAVIRHGFKSIYDIMSNCEQSSFFLISLLSPLCYLLSLCNKNTIKHRPRWNFANIKSKSPRKISSQLKFIDYTILRSYHSPWIQWSLMSFSFSFYSKVPQVVQQLQSHQLTHRNMRKLKLNKLFQIELQAQFFFAQSRRTVSKSTYY